VTRVEIGDRTLGWCRCMLLGRLVGVGSKIYFEPKLLLEMETPLLSQQRSCLDRQVSRVLVWKFEYWCFIMRKRINFASLPLVGTRLSLRLRHELNWTAGVWPGCWKRGCSGEGPLARHSLQRCLQLSLGAAACGVGGCLVFFGSKD